MPGVWMNRSRRWRRAGAGGRGRRLGGAALGSTLFSILMRAERGLWIFTLRREPPPFIHPHGPRARPPLPPGPAFAPLPPLPPPPHPPRRGAARFPAAGRAARGAGGRGRREDGGGGRRWLYRHVQQEIMKRSVDAAAVYLWRKLLFTGNGADLQVCTSKNPTCCTKKMEERYQTAARQDIQQVLQTSSAPLKFLISRNAAAFQETFEMLIRLAENYTSTLFCNAYRNMAAEATTRVQEFFTDVGLFIFGTDVNTEEFVNRFFDTLFPVVYNHVINPGLTDISLEYAECLRMKRRDIRPFGNIPRKAIGQMGRSLLPSRTFLQALNLGIEVINTTDHLHFSKDCSRALLRMQYCPHCQGLTLSRPCMGYCLNIIRGCLANVAEVDLHWRVYIQSLEELSSAMSGTYDIEHVLLNFHLLVNDAVVQAHINGPELSEQVSKVCGPPVRKPIQSPGCSFDQNKDNQVLKMFSRDSEETLTNRRKEFISHLRLYRAFYGGLADQLCGNELAAADGLPCWNGEDVVRSYTHRVVGSGIKAQSANPEVKVKGTDPVISQIIDKLKHVIQLLQGKSFPNYDKWDLRQTGSGGGSIDEQISGDCDDEDGCGGSGSGEVKTVLKITDWMPDKTNLSDVKHIRQTNDGSTSDTTGAGCTTKTDYMTFVLISLVTLLFLSLW
ncbi:glypican-5 [Falco cherrug]|uniref:glypican-5 n=1 Tax=Falco cherrug TaxID=345164 RepID=UPI0024787A5B|nr:glypican-5 [Falco cherrug]